MNKVFRSLKVFVRLARPDRGLFGLSVGLVAVASLFEGLSVGLIIPLLDVLVRGGDYRFAATLPLIHKITFFFPSHRLRYFFLAVLAAILALVILKNALMYWSELMMNWVSRAAEHSLRTQVFQRYLSFGKKFFDRNKSGNLSDLAIYQVLLSCTFFRDLHNWLLYLFLSSVYLVMMLFISWKLTLMALALLPGLYLVVKVISKKIMHSTRDKFKIDQEMNSYIVDALANMSLIRSYTNEAAEAAQYNEISRRSRINQNSIWKKILIAPYLQETILTFVLAILLTLCVFVFLKGSMMGVALFLSFFIVMRRFAGNLSALGATYTQLAKTMEPIKQLSALFDDEGKYFVVSGERPFGGLKQGITFEKVTFGYNGSPVLNGLDLHFEKGKMTAIVGPTGAGKTTIINLIPRFYDPTEGRILMDDVPIERFDLASLRRKIAIVDQDASIFNTTIRRNITYGFGPGVPEARLDEVSKKAFLYDFIMSLPQKYDTPVGDRGVQLSGGEKQRVAIARALLKDPELFVFDEATSSLDVETERQIQKAIDNMTQGRTVIAIAHRLSTIKRADYIYVVEAGRVVEQGTFRDLLKRTDGRFYYYWNLHWTETDV